MSTIKPALSEEEWAKFHRSVTDCMDDTAMHLCIENMASIQKNAHAMAAAALHGQPFGFTREDVALLRAYADWDLGGRNSTDFDDLADRIEALLPPELTRTNPEP